MYSKEDVLPWGYGVINAQSDDEEFDFSALTDLAGVVGGFGEAAK